MAFQPNILSVELSEKNESAGLYHFLVRFNGVTCRVFYEKNPTLKAKSVTRLLAEPCPICKADYYCNCMQRFLEPIEQQINERGLITPEMVASE